jgi:hypothetical protein
MVPGMAPSGATAHPIRLAAAVLSIAGWVAWSAAAPASPQPAARSAVRHDPTRDTLAWVGGHAITADDLSRRIELMPWPPKQGRASLDTARVRALRSLAGERLLAIAAEREGFGDTGIVARASESLRKALARDALYHDVTRDAAVPLPSEVERIVRARAPGAGVAARRALRRAVSDSLAGLAAGQRAREFMIGVLGGQRAEVDSATLVLLADTLYDLVATRPRESGGAANGVGEYADLLLSRLYPALDRPLARLQGGPFTLGDAIESLRFYSFTLRSRTRAGFAAELSSRLREIVEGELMSREALRRGLDRRPEVRRDLDTWTTAWRAQWMIARAAAGPDATPDEAFRELALDQPEVARAGAEVDVREILSETRERALRVCARLEAGASFDSLARALTRRVEWADRGGRSGWFAAARHPHLGTAALIAPTDSLSGPVWTPEGWSVFAVAGKRIAADSTAAAAALAEAGRLATARARAARVSDLIAELAAREGVRFDLGALRRVEIAPANMVTKRLLGFGGGMLAAPSLPPLWDWLRGRRTAPAPLP